MEPAAVLSRGWGISHRRSLPNGAMSGLPSLLCFLAVVLVLASNFGVHAAAGPTVGMVTKIENQAQIGTETAVVGTLVHMNDELRTGPKAHLEVTFRDKTTLTLGENAKVTIDRYVFNPAESTGELVLTTGVAAFRLATGQIGEMHKKDINVTTPAAAMAVRGTDFWWTH
jgi:hypothetical protein